LDPLQDHRIPEIRRKEKRKREKKVKYGCSGPPPRLPYQEEFEKKRKKV